VIIIIGAFVSLVGGDSADESSIIPPNNVSSHVLDISQGKAAANINVTAFRFDDAQHKWVELANT